jgi:hypothetical protein
VASLGALTAVLGGCYRYAPLTDGSPAPGADVRLALGPGASPELFKVLGDRTEAVDGRIASAADSGYVVMVSGTRKQGETGTVSWAGERVLIPRAAIAGMQRRTLDKKRTFGVAGIAFLAAAATALIVDGLGSNSGGNDGGVTPPPPP